MKRPIEVRRSLPKYLTSARFFSGRSHSAVHNINNGPGESVFKLCKAVDSTIHGGTRVRQALKQQQKSVIATANAKERKHTKTLYAERDVHCIAYMKKIKKKLITAKHDAGAYTQQKNATVNIHTQELMVQKQNRLNVDIICNMISLI